MLVWILTFIWYHHKKMVLDTGSVIMFMYILYAFFSVLSINDPLFSEAYKPLKLFPYIYLYTMLMIALSPIIIHHDHPSESIENPNTRILVIIGCIIVFSAILMIPGIITQANKGILNLFVDETAAKEVYTDQVDEVSDSGGAIRNLPAVIYNSLSDITVFLLFYFLSLKNSKHKLVIYGLAFTTVLGIIIPITHGQRGGVVSCTLTVVVGYFLFKPYLSKKINKAVKKIGVIAMIVISLPIIAITMSRFGKENAGVGGFINWYLGQGSLYFNNNGLDAGGIRYGDRTINLFKRIIDPGTPKNFVERRDKYHNLELDDNFFSTFVGDFTIDFGPILAFAIFVCVFYMISRKTRLHYTTIKLHQLLLIYFTACISIQGGMTLFSYADTGNLRIITLLGLYAYLRYHEVLLIKYPKE